jgi:hypothetical protein
MIWEFVSVFTNIRAQQKFTADDSVDKLNRSFTVIILIISAILIGTRQLVGPSIICADDGHRLTSEKMDYIESVW